MGSIKRAVVHLAVGVACTAITCGAASAEQVAIYQSGPTVAFDPELYGWNGVDVGGAAGRGVLDTAGAAWQVADPAVGGDAPRYFQPLGGRYLADARDQGWRMTATARLAAPSGGSPSMGLGVYFDAAAYLLQLDLEGGELFASLWDNTSATGLLNERLAGVADALAYHDYELRWSPNRRLTSLYFDGQHVADWDGVPTTHGAGGNYFQFGASTATGSGVMNFRRVEFETIEASASDGDYNQDGRTDAADYAVWRDNLAGNLSAADGNGDGLVDQQDYVVWRSHFGAAAAAGNAAPEPAAILLACWALLPRNWRRRRAARG